MTKKTNFDRYIQQKIKKYPPLRKELKKAERAWDIALQIRELREKRGLTQKQLAALAGTSQPNIARIENADYQSYTLKALDKATQALKARIDVVVVPEEKIEEHKKYFPRPVFAMPVSA